MFGLLCLFLSYYLQNDIWVNIYTVDSKWLYSLYWCMNVTSITTNRCHEFAQMTSPVWHMVCVHSVGPLHLLCFGVALFFMLCHICGLTV